MPDDPLPAELSKKRKQLIDAAREQWNKGNREPMRQLSPDIAYFMEDPKKVAITMRCTQEQDGREVNRIADDIMETYVDPRNTDAITRADRTLDVLAKEPAFGEVIRMLVEEKVLGADRLFDPDGYCNAKCLTGVYQFLWKYGFFKKGLFNKRIPKMKILEFLNTKFKSNIGNDFYRTDDSFINYAMERLPGLKKFIK